MLLAGITTARASELVVDGTGGDDRFLLQLDAATAERVEVWLGGSLAGSMALQNLNGVTLNGLLGDDLVEVAYANGFFDVPTTVNGGGNTTSTGDGLLVTGTGHSGGTTIYALGGIDPEGKSGILFEESGGRVHEIRFTGLEPVCTLTVGTITINATSGTDVIRVLPGPLCGSDATYKLDFDGAAEEIYFRNKTSLTINAEFGADDLTLDLPTRVDTALDSIALSGGAGADTIIIKNAPAHVTVLADGGDDPDSVQVWGSAATQTVLDGGSGNDAFFLGNAASSLSDLKGPIQVSGQSNFVVPTFTLAIGGTSNTLPAGDLLEFRDSGDPGSYAATLSATGFDRDGMAGSVSYVGVETLNYYASSGTSSITVGGTADSTNTVIQTQDGNDQVIVSATGISSNLTVNAQGGADSVTVSDAGGFVATDGGAQADLFNYQGAPAALFPASTTEGFVAPPAAGARIGYTSFEGVIGKYLLDFGDAPDPAFPTLLATNGARHAGDGTLHLGATWDGELDGQPNASASGDGGDEDGIAFTSAIELGPDSTGGTLDVTTSAFGKLDAWIDFNADGDFVDSGEQIYTSAAVTGTVNESFTSFADRRPGATFGRFRLSSSGGLAVTGLANDGEVEDYAITLQPPLDLDLFNRVDSGPREFWACNSISAGDPSGYGVVAGAVTFEAGSLVVLRDGFSVATGASFSVVLGPVAGCTP